MELQHHVPKSLRGSRGIGCVGIIFLERNRIGNFARHGPDVDIDAQRCKRAKNSEWNATTDIASKALDQQNMIDEIERDIE